MIGRWWTSSDGAQSAINAQLILTGHSIDMHPLKISELELSVISPAAKTILISSSADIVSHLCQSLSLQTKFFSLSEICGSSRRVHVLLHLEMIRRGRLSLALSTNGLHHEVFF